MSETTAVSDAVDSGQRQGRFARIALRVYRHSLTRFAAFGAFGLTFDVTLLQILLITTPMSLLVATTIAFAATYLMNFFLNRTFSFHAHGHLERHLGRFIPQVTLDYLLTLGGVSFFVWLGLPVIGSRILAGTTNAILNYTAYRWWTFHRRRGEE